MPRKKPAPSKPARAAPGAVQDTLDILLSFGASEPLLGVNEIARRVGIDKSRVSRIMKTLEAAYFVERDSVTGRFRLGGGVVALAAPTLLDLDVRKVAHPYLERLAKDSGETANLSIWRNGMVITVDQVIGAGPVLHLASPSQSPVHCTASGKAILAHADHDMVQSVIAAGLARVTELTITDPARLLRELDEVRRAGFAVSDGEFMADTSGVAAAIRRATGEIVAVVSLAIPRYRFSAERRAQLGKLIIDTARGISRYFGA